MADSMQQAIFNGSFIAAHEKAVSIHSRGLMYGDGCFETFCSYSGHFFKLTEHLKRLNNGLSFLNINCPGDLQKQNLRPILIKLLQTNNLFRSDAVIRLQVWREGDRGYATDSSNASYAITASPHKKPKDSYRLATVSTRRIPHAALPAGFKFTNGINYITAARQARIKGADDALMQTVDDHPAETTIANIFWKRGDTVFTPSVNCDILPGITRKIVLALLRSRLSINVEQGKFMLESLKNADVVWICNSVKGVAAVQQIDSQKYEIDAPFLKALQDCYETYIQNYLSLNK